MQQLTTSQHSVFLHNLLHKRSTGRHTASRTLRVISASGRTYYSTGRSLKWLRLQHSTRYLRPTFVSSKNRLPVFIVFSALWRCRNPADPAKNSPSSRSLCAQWEKTHAPLPMHAYPDVMCMCMHVLFDATCMAHSPFTATTMKSRLPGPDQLCVRACVCGWGRHIHLNKAPLPLQQLHANINRIRLRRSCESGTMTPLYDLDPRTRMFQLKALVKLYR